MNELTDIREKSGVRTEIFKNKNLLIEGCDSLIDLSDEFIKLKSGHLYIEIKGKNLTVTNLTESSLSLRGNIHSLSFRY